MNIGKLMGVIGSGLLLLSLGAPIVQAQEVTLPTRTTLLPTKNTREIGFAASYLFNGDKPYAVSASYGLFTSPTLEVGLTGTVAGAEHTSTFSSVGGFADYYFRGGEAIEDNPQLVPYIGAFLGYSHQDESDASAGGQIGGKYFFNPNVALAAEIQYRSTRHGSGNTQLVVGLSTFFR